MGELYFHIIGLFKFLKLHPDSYVFQMGGGAEQGLLHCLKDTFLTCIFLTQITEKDKTI